MRLVIQRVSEAHVDINSETVASIGKGLLVLVAVEKEDTAEDAEWLAAKTVNMRIFPDKDDVMNLSLLDVGGEILSVSQFTLTASTRKGNRPSYIRAAGHELAVSLYELYNRRLEEMTGSKVPTGHFGADMKVALVNDGPVTIIIDSRLKE